MLFAAFIGGSYEGSALTADAEDCWNWYAEAIQSSGAPFKTVLLPTPGVQALSDRAPLDPRGSSRGRGAGRGGGGGTVPMASDILSDTTSPGGGTHLTPGRAHLVIGGREFAVIGDAFVEIDAAGRQTIYKVWRDADQDYTGALAYDANPATLSTNGDAGRQILITSGGHAYIFWLSNNTLFEVADLIGKASMGFFLEGYFIVLDTTTSTIYVSTLENGLEWDVSGVGWAQRSLQPDRWLSGLVCGRFIWLLGEHTSECWYNTGGEFPFAPHPSGAVGFGVAAPWSPRLMGSDAVWVARSASGRKCVVKASGFTPEIISTYPIETQFQSYDTLEDAIGDSYSERGHAFYLIHFDRQDITWAWDAETKLWSKRGTWLRDEGRYVAWRPRYYAYAYNEHRMLDGAGPTLFRLSSDLATDVDGDGIRRVRRAPALNNENKRVYFSRFELELERAQGTLFPSEVVIGLLKRFRWTEAAESYSVDFIAECQGSIALWSWSFGDGDSEDIDSENITHVYPSSNASYTVTLTITYNDATTATLSGIVTIDYTNGGSGVAEETPTSTTTDVTGIAPQVMLRQSNDGGKTWQPERWRSAGKKGEWSHRVYWNQLGAARKRVFEVSVSDPVPWKLVGAYLEVAGG